MCRLASKNEISWFMRKAHRKRQIDDPTVSAAKCLHFLALQHGGQTS